MNPSEYPEGVPLSCAQHGETLERFFVFRREGDTLTAPARRLEVQRIANDTAIQTFLVKHRDCALQMEINGTSSIFPHGSFRDGIADGSLAKSMRTMIPSQGVA